MQDADITSITRELAGLVGERYVFPDLAAEISRLLESRLAEGCYAAAPDEEALAAALTQDLQSLNGDKHLRLLHSAADLPERGDEAAGVLRPDRDARLRAHRLARHTGWTAVTPCSM